MSRIPRRSALLAVGLVFAFVIPGTVSANHSWGGYHWARTSNPFTLNLGDRLTDPWHLYLATTSADWNVSSVLHTTIVPGTAVKRLCSATAGTVQVCNSKYGNNGWLGIASIWASGDHITQGTVKLNDTYFATSGYNTAAWRNMVMCQEVGHTLGLDHQDINQTNPDLLDPAGVASCMDYTNDPIQNQQPNAHDYEQLATIYAHLDSTTTVAAVPAASAAAVADDAAEAAWGRLVEVTNQGQGAWYVRDLGAGNLILTHVFWANR